VGAKIERHLHRFEHEEVNPNVHSEPSQIPRTGPQGPMFAPYENKLLHTAIKNLVCASFVCYVVTFPNYETIKLSNYQTKSPARVGISDRFGHAIMGCRDRGKSPGFTNPIFYGRVVAISGTRMSARYLPPPAPP
jgi:hypothetical protein